ncbi:TRP-domain-containing protein [Cladorrhinum samala]|uniref:TRP-domain-containing protein n=1 Tax=Cladorrhinum samala TaxID=585594 RepID=A0AAV9HGH2_9PEZI|nr:TRP-domain-containing protein [Cladorrhinum samala]
MTAQGFKHRLARTALAGLALAHTALGGRVLYTAGDLGNCLPDSAVTVEALHIKFDYGSRTINFTIAGTSTETLNVTANLNLLVYGKNISATQLDPCSNDSFVSALCPIRSGSFSASHMQTVSAEQAGQVPGVAYILPDIAAASQLRLFRQRVDGTGGGSPARLEQVACTENRVTNGVTSDIPGLTYAAVAVAVASLLASGVTSVAQGGSGGGTAANSIGPGFTDVFGWFQIMALNGMMSLKYPLVYQKFSKNFGFSFGLTSWPRLQRSIERFRADTGGNLTADSTGDLGAAPLLSGAERDAVKGCVKGAVSGIRRYCRSQKVAQGSAFMTVLVVLLIVVAAVIVAIPFFKSVIELWARRGRLPEKLERYRKRYWGAIGRALATGLLLFCTPLVAFSIFQLRAGDSRAARAIAGIVLVLVTSALAALSWMIWNSIPLEEGKRNPSKLFEDKELWVRYNFMYAWYRRDFWWVFMVIIFYKLALGVVLAAADGSPMGQAVARMVVELPLLGLLVWARPFELRSGNILGIATQAVNVILAGFNFAFLPQQCMGSIVEGVLGLVLVAIYGFATVVFAVLILLDLIIKLRTANPHREQRLRENAEADKDANDKPEP